MEIEQKSLSLSLTCESVSRIILTLTQISRKRHDDLSIRPFFSIKCIQEKIHFRYNPRSK